MNRKKAVGMACLCALGAAPMASGIELYVSPQGSNQGVGTKDAPFQTIERAQQAAREIDTGKPGETVVYLRGGTYSIDHTIKFDARDSGTETHPVVYRAYPGERPVSSGGTVLGNWEKAGPTLYKASTGGMEFRQLYVDGAKALRSRHPNTGEFLPIVRWDMDTRKIIMPPGTLQDWLNFDEVEMYLQQAWSISIMRMETYAAHPEGFALTVRNPERDLVFKRKYPRKRDKQYYHLENAREFIDQPGEWCVDRKEGICHYLPRSGEDMASAEVIVPQVETLVSVQGTLDDPVRHMRFEGITFKHSNWTMPYDQGYLNVQAGQYTIEPTVGNTQYVGRPPAAVYVAGAQNLVFKRNVFTKLGSTALDLHYGTRDCEVVGNVFYNIAGSGISHAKLSDPDVEFHTPYNPEDKREMSVNDRIHNNYIELVGDEYGGCVGIVGGYSTAVKIDHNELRDIAYSGISLGWGWTYEPNAMRDNMIRWNHIDNPCTIFADGAGIYTLSEMPGSLISSNFVSNVSRPEKADSKLSSKCYYLDMASGGITFDRNHVKHYDHGVERWFFHQPGEIKVTRLDSSMYPGIIEAAGLEPEYKDIKGLVE